MIELQVKEKCETNYPSLKNQTNLNQKWLQGFREKNLNTQAVRTDAILIGQYMCKCSVQALFFKLQTDTNTVTKHDINEKFDYLSFECRTSLLWNL